MPFNKMIFASGCGMAAWRSACTKIVGLLVAELALLASLAMPLHATKKSYREDKYTAVANTEPQADRLIAWNLSPELVKTWRTDVMQATARALQGQIAVSDILRRAEDIDDEYLASASKHFGVPADEKIIGVYIRRFSPGEQRVRKEDLIDSHGVHHQTTAALPELLLTDRKVYYEVFSYDLDQKGTEDAKESKIMKGYWSYLGLTTRYSSRPAGRRFTTNENFAIVTFPDASRAAIDFRPANVFTALSNLAKEYIRRSEREIARSNDQQSTVPAFAGFRTLLWGSSTAEVKQRIKPQGAEGFVEAKVPAKFWNNLGALDEVSQAVIRDTFRFWDNKDTPSDRKLVGFPLAPDLNILLVKERNEKTRYYFVDDKLYVVEVEPHLSDVNGSDLLTNLGEKYGVCEKRSSDFGRAAIYHWSDPKGMIKVYCTEPGSSNVRLSAGEYLGADGSKHNFTTFFVADLSDGVSLRDISGVDSRGKSIALELPLRPGARLPGRTIVLQYEIRPEYSDKPTSEFLRPPAIIDARGNIYEELSTAGELLVGWKSAGSVRVQDVRNGSGTKPPPMISLFQVPADAADLRLLLPDKTLLYLPLYAEQLVAAGAIKALLPQKGESRVDRIFYLSTEVRTYVSDKLKDLTRGPDSEAERKRRAKDAAEKF